MGMKESGSAREQREIDWDDCEAMWMKEEEEVRRDIWRATEEKRVI